MPSSRSGPRAPSRRRLSALVTNGGEKCGLATRVAVMAAIGLFAVFFELSAQAAAFNEDGYTLGTGDKIHIQVYGEDDLELEAIIGDKGVISYPFLGSMRVSGMTVRNLEARITKGLKGDYLIDPKVSVNIIEYRNFFVNGEVKAPGGFPYQPEITVRKAISLAGGFTERASREKIFIIHENDPSGEMHKVDENGRVRPGDIVTVEESFF